jgi:hypothetical protein
MRPVPRRRPDVSPRVLHEPRPEVGARRVAVTANRPRVRCRDRRRPRDPSGRSGGDQRSTGGPRADMPDRRRSAHRRGHRADLPRRGRVNDRCGPPRRHDDRWDCRGHDGRIRRRGCSVDRWSGGGRRRVRRRGCGRAGVGFTGGRIVRVVDVRLRRCGRRGRRRPGSRLRARVRVLAGLLRRGLGAAAVRVADGAHLAGRLIGRRLGRGLGRIGGRLARRRGSSVPGRGAGLRRRGLVGRRGGSRAVACRRLVGLRFDR